MSFDKDYPRRKDIRKQYFGSKAIDKTCRCNGSCAYCKKNRLFNDHKKRQNAEEQIKSFFNLSQ